MKYAIALAALFVAASPALAAPITLSGSGDQWFTFNGTTGGIEIFETYTTSNPPPLSLFDDGQQQWSLTLGGLSPADWGGATGPYIYYLDLTGTGGSSWSLEFHGEASEPTKVDFPPWLAPAPVPLPAALPLFASGLGGLGALRFWRKRKKAA